MCGKVKAAKPINITLIIDSYKLKFWVKNTITITPPIQEIIVKIKVEYNTNVLFEMCKYILFIRCFRCL